MEVDICNHITDIVLSQKLWTDVCLKQRRTGLFPYFVIVCCACLVGPMANAEQHISFCAKEDIKCYCLTSRHDSQTLVPITLYMKWSVNQAQVFAAHAKICHGDVSQRSHMQPASQYKSSNYMLLFCCMFVFSSKCTWYNKLRAWVKYVHSSEWKYHSWNILNCSMTHEGFLIQHLMSLSSQAVHYDLTVYVCPFIQLCP